MAVTTVATNRVRFACLEICRKGLTSPDLIVGAAMYRMSTGHGGLSPDDADTIVANRDAGTGQLINLERAEPTPQV